MQDAVFMDAALELAREAFADGEGCTRWTLYADGRCEPVFPG